MLNSKSSTRGRIRAAVIYNALQSCLGSKLCHLLILLYFNIRIILSWNTTIFTYTTRFQFIFILLLMTSLIYAVMFLRLVIFEFLVTHHVVASIIGLFDWWTLVDDNLYLGGEMTYLTRYRCLMLASI